MPDADTTGIPFRDISRFGLIIFPGMTAGMDRDAELEQLVKELEQERQRRIDSEKQLGETNEMLESLLSTLPVGVVIIDAATRNIIDVNPQGLVTFESSLEALVGKRCTDYICPAEKDSCPILDKGQELDRSEREILTPDGTRVPVLKSVVQTEINGHRVLIECFTDIRNKKQAEKENIKKEKLEAILELAGAVCHEFNQPLQIITGYCDLLKGATGIDSSGREAIDVVSDEVARMGELTRNLMQITHYRTKPYLHSKIIDILASSRSQDEIEKSAG